MQLKYKLLRLLAYGIEIVLLYVAQNTPGLLPPLLGVRPVLVLCALITFAMMEDEKTGLGFGIFTGLLLDLSAGNAIGLYAAVLGIIGFFCGLLAANLIKTNLLTALALCAAGVFVFLGLQFVFTFLLHNYDYASQTFVNFYLPLMLYSFIPAPVLYFINRAVAALIRERT